MPLSPHAEKFRYFIELPTAGEDELPRIREIELRRAQAQNLIAYLRDWVASNGFESRVAALSVTAFGQVQITCEADLFQRIRNFDVMSAATIRANTAMLADDRFSYLRKM